MARNNQRPRRHLVQCLAIGIAFAAAVPASAQVDLRSTIREVEIGAPITDLPTDFQELACGTNGGPPSLPLASFAEFAKCPAEATGLHEVQFRYDDEIHYIALARRDALRAELFQGTKFGNYPILASVLIDDAGIVRGVRAVTDDRVSDRTRRSAHSMAQYVRSVYGSEGWDCIDIPAEEGETPVGNNLLKQDCRKLEDDLLYLTEARLLRRPGQSLIDPANGLMRPGYWESTARLDIYQVDESGEVVASPGPAFDPVAEAPDQIPSDPVEAFLIGATKDCPGCDLAGAQLQRRNLADADLSDTNLAGASLHRAVLGGASLEGANLTGANLNLADLKRASFVGADLTDAYFYQTDAAAADFSGAVLDGISAENARFTGATMTGVSWQMSRAPNANLAGADLTGAVLTGTELPDADLQSAVLAGADLTDTWLYGARFRSADLTGATAVRADFLQADLSDAIFVDADLTEAQLLRARSDGLDLTGAILVETTMPDGSISR